MHVDKLYVVTRTDLEPGQRAVQACHAATQFQVDFPGEAQGWYERSNTIALLEVPSQTHLERLAWEAKQQGVKVALFREPDRSDELTAIALEPG